MRRTSERAARSIRPAQTRCAAFLAELRAVPERAPDAGKTISARQFLVPSAQDCNLAAAWLKIDVDALRPSWKQFDSKVDLLQSHLITLADEARWAMARGHVAKGLVSNFLPHLYLDALLAVEPERVTVLH